MKFGIKILVDGKTYERYFNTSRNNVVLEMFVDSARLELEVSRPIILEKDCKLPKELSDTCRYFAHINGVGTLEMTHEEYLRAVTERDFDIKEEEGKVDSNIDVIKKELTDCSNNLAEHIQELQGAVEDLKP